MKLPGILLDYSANIAKVFGDTVLQPVSPMLMFSAIQDLASVSSVLSKLFKSQNAISAPTNVSIDEWARMEAARLQSIREGEAKQEVIDNNAPQVKASGDNQPTGTQGIRDADSIKQEGTGLRRKKKKLSEMMGGAQIDWGIANPGGQVVPTPNPNNPVNNIPVAPLPVNISVKPPPLTGWQIATQAAGFASGAIGFGVAAYNAKKTYEAYQRGDDLEAQRRSDREYRDRQEGRDIQRERRDNARFLDEIERNDRQRADELNQQAYERDRYAREEEALRIQTNLFKAQQQYFDLPIRIERKRQYDLWLQRREEALERHRQLVRDINDANIEALRMGREQITPPEFNFDQNHPFVFDLPEISGQGKTRKKSKSKKSKTKKSKNLDAQILALLKA
jgi:hypothetical protein